MHSVGGHQTTELCCFFFSVRLIHSILWALCFSHMSVDILDCTVLDFSTRHSDMQHLSFFFFFKLFEQAWGQPQAGGSAHEGASTSNKTLQGLQLLVIALQLLWYPRHRGSSSFLCLIERLLANWLDACDLERPFQYVTSILMTCLSCD